MKNIKEKFYRWKAKFSLIHKYIYLIENDKLLEEYETKKILDGGMNEEQLQKSRAELLRIQFRLKSENHFVDFLKSL
jgi:hypothetical protein